MRFSGAGAVTVDLSQTAEQNTGHGRDTLRELENAYGSVGDDHLIGNTGHNELDGGNGGDILDGRGGAADLRGGTGSDTVSYAHAQAGVTIDLSRMDQPNGGDRIYFVENVIGSPFGDTLTAGDAPQSRIVAGAGFSRRSRNSPHGTSPPAQGRHSASRISPTTSYAEPGPPHLGSAERPVPVVHPGVAVQADAGGRSARRGFSAGSHVTSTCSGPRCEVLGG